MTRKVAPEDSSKWKCNWIACVGGCGLSGNGRCSENGEWDNPNCPKFVDAEILAENSRHFVGEDDE